MGEQQRQNETEFREAQACPSRQGLHTHTLSRNLICHDRERLDMKTGLVVGDWNAQTGRRRSA